MFGFGGSNNNTRMPKQPRGMITPKNYGYSTVFIDDDSQMVLDWEFNGGIPTQEMADKARETSAQRSVEADLSDELKENLSSISKDNARIISNLASAKSAAARGSKRQYDEHYRHYNTMDRLDLGYQLTAKKRNFKLADVREAFDFAVEDLKKNANARQKQRKKKAAAPKTPATTTS